MLFDVWCTPQKGPENISCGDGDSDDDDNSNGSSDDNNDN